MRYLRFTQDVLVFTDAHRTVGCVIDDSRHPKGHPVTSGLLRLLEDTVFDPERTTTPSHAELQRSGLGPSDEARDLSGLDAFLATSVSLGWGAAPQPIGDTVTEQLPEDSVLALDGNAVWCPAGVRARRRVGEATVHFVVSPMDLRGSVQVDQRVLASPVSAAGPDLRLVADAQCGVCGVCGVCAICAEINAAAPAGAISAIMAIGEFQNMPSPEDRRALLEATYRTQYAAEQHARRVAVDL